MVLNRAVSRTHWNMTSTFSLFSSADNVSLPKIMSCTVLSDKTNYVTSLFSAQHIVGSGRKNASGLHLPHHRNKQGCL